MPRVLEDGIKLRMLKRYLANPPPHGWLRHLVSGKIPLATKSTDAKQIELGRLKAKLGQLTVEKDFLSGRSGR